MDVKKGVLAASCLGCGGAVVFVLVGLYQLGTAFNRAGAPSPVARQAKRGRAAQPVAVLDLAALMQQPRADVQKAFRVKPENVGDGSEMATVKGLGDVTLIYRGGRLRQFFVTLKPTRATAGDALRAVGYAKPSAEPFRQSDAVVFWNQDAKGRAFKRLGASRSNGAPGFDYVAAELP